MSNYLPTPSWQSGAGRRDTSADLLNMLYHLQTIWLSPILGQFLIFSQYLQWRSSCQAGHRTETGQRQNREMNKDAGKMQI